VDLYGAVAMPMYRSALRDMVEVESNKSVGNEELMQPCCSQV